MLLIFDVGNSGVNVGLFRDHRMVLSGRFARGETQTAERHAADLSMFLSARDISPRSVEHIALGSVVRSWEEPLSEACRQVLGQRPVAIHGRMELGLQVCYDDPDHVGIDRLAAAVGAYDMTGGAVIVVDVGTAITVDAVSGEGAFLGGLIAPGIQMSVDALHEKTDLLPLVRPEAPASILGRSTVECIQSGIVYGTAAMLDGLVRRIQGMLEEEVKVVGTGGGLALLLPLIDGIHRVEPYLVLKGLQRIFERERRKMEKTGVGG